MPTWDLLDRALGHLESPAFEGCRYVAGFRGRLEAELRRIFEWLDNTDGGVELHPSASASYLAETVLEMRGCAVLEMEPCDVVREALLVLNAERDVECGGRLPGRLINNYFTLHYALEYGDCSVLGVISLAKTIILANT